MSKVTFNVEPTKYGYHSVDIEIDGELVERRFQIADFKDAMNVARRLKQEWQKRIQRLESTGRLFP